jgi:hypothetical protein
MGFLKKVNKSRVLSFAVMVFVVASLCCLSVYALDDSGASASTIEGTLGTISDTIVDKIAPALESVVQPTVIGLMGFLALKLGVVKILSFVKTIIGKA